jgi:glucose-6-phosphate 1-dehydrogenase
MDAIAERLLKPEAAPERTPVPPFDLVIFGAGGDLALRKLFPALAQRNEEGVLPEESRILGIVRKQEDVEGIPNEIAAKLAAAGLSQDRIAAFRRRLTMVLLDAVKPETYGALKEALGDSQRVRSFYLSTPPDLFIPICENLASSGILTPTSRVILEKPIGRDLASARALNDQIGQHLRRAPDLPDRPLSRQGDGAEPDGAALRQRAVRAALERRPHRPCPDHCRRDRRARGPRAGYYDKAGALRDMVQNHILQLLCLWPWSRRLARRRCRPRREAEGAAALRRSTAAMPRSRHGARPVSRPASSGGAVRGYADELGAPAAPRPSSPSRRDRTGAGPACPSICAPASGSPARASEIVSSFKPVPHSIFGEQAGDGLCQPAGHPPAARRGRAAVDDDQGSRAGRHAPAPVPLDMSFAQPSACEPGRL